MDIYLLYIIFFILILFYIILNNKNDNIKNKIKLNELKKNIVIKTKSLNLSKSSDILKKPKTVLNYCNVPVLNTEQCYKSKYYKCPNTDGSYTQCTNNYIPSPDNFNALCENRTFEMVDSDKRISENCYNILTN